jgi:type I restriction enzyme, S subunit
VILGRKGMGNLGVEWCDSDFWVIDTAYYVRPLTSELDLRYFYYLVKYVGLNHLKDGTSNPSLTREAFGAQLLPFPSRAEQQAVAAVLKALDDKIDLNRRMNQTLEATAQTLFKSWFVDFDPVRAKAEGQTPAGLSAEIADVFPASFEDSALGPIPSGWRVKPIGDVVRVVGGSTPSTTEPSYWEGGQHAWATPKDLSRLTSPVLLDTERKITDAGLRQIASGLLPKGIVLLSSRAPIGYLAIAEVPTAVNQGFIAMPCEGDLSNHYILQWLREKIEFIKGRANGTTFLEVSKTNFRPIPVVVPPRGVTDVFTRKAAVLHQRVVANLRESRTLATLRDTLLPKLLSGEVRVREAEKLVAAVA